jgi:hypothetical protein
MSNILKFGTTYRRAVSFTFRPFFHRYPLNRTLDGPERGVEPRISEIRLLYLSYIQMLSSELIGLLLLLFKRYDNVHVTVSLIDYRTVEFCFTTKNKTNMAAARNSDVERY